jgi:hypothetical protein
MGTVPFSEPTLTAAGEVMGTPQYMAPEQIEHPKDVDHRADIYSLGVVFYQMLTGELPIGRFAPPSRKVQIDVRLDEVVLRALEKEPEHRYQQASDLKTHVETIATTSPQVAFGGTASGGTGDSPASASAAVPPVDAKAIADEILAREYTLSIGSCLSRGWRLLVADFWPVAGSTALVVLLLHAAGALQPLAIVLAGPLLGGLCLFLLRRIRGAQSNMETVFADVRLAFTSRFFPLLLTGLASTVLTLAGLLCLILPGIFLAVVWLFALPLVIDKRLDCWPAMELSRKTVSKHWWEVFGLLIILALINLAGLIVFWVGVFFTAPLTVAALMYAYEDIFGSASRAAKKPEGESGATDESGGTGVKLPVPPLSRSPRIMPSSTRAGSR